MDNKGWIKAEEKLPNDGECVLVLASGAAGKNITLINAYMIALYYKDEGFILEDYPECEHIVTHWMPLPEKPEGVQI